jgi:hypothetical protein
MSGYPTLVTHVLTASTSASRTFFQILGLLSFCMDGAKPIQPILGFRISCEKIARRKEKGLGM